MTDRELDEILIYWWPKVLRRAMTGADDWAKSFCRSIARHGKRAAWRPSAKQAFLMRRFVSEVREAPKPDLNLIEEDDAA